MLPVVTAVLTLLLCRSEGVEQSIQKEKRKLLMMHYMPWYETPAIRGHWGSHWKGHASQHQPERLGETGLPDIWSHFHPLIGPYDSTDPDALECHLLQMKLAGVDGVIVDWYGISDAADYPSIQQGSRAMFAATGRFGMKFAACYEDRSVEWLVQQKKLQPEQVTGHLTQTMQWMQAQWFTQPQYLHLQERPLLLNFGPIYLSERTTWAAALDSVPVRPLYFALHHLWKGVGADGGFSWVHEGVWSGNPDGETIKQRLRGTYAAISGETNQVIVSACPGFQDVYEQHLPELPYRDGATLRESLAVGLQGAWPVVQLVTWNDYGEGTMIEPTHEFGYTFLEIVQQARRAELGAGFLFKPEDLRLPARLYALRKKGGVTPEALSRIAQFLSAGSCQKARVELEELEKP